MDVNHRRKNRKPVNQRYAEREYNNGYAHPDNKRNVAEVSAERAELEAKGFTLSKWNHSSSAQRVGRTDYLDKSMHSWGRKSQFADTQVGSHIGNDFSKGHRGMAKAVRGAKKFVRTRIRFHENQKLKKITANLAEVLSD